VTWEIEDPSEAWEMAFEALTDSRGSSGRSKTVPEHHDKGLEQCC